MYQFTFRCKKCGTNPEGYDFLGHDGKLNLVIQWFCDTCDEEITAVAPIEYLFNIRKVEEPEEEPKQLEENAEEFDKGFLQGLHILWEDAA